MLDIKNLKQQFHKMPKTTAQREIKMPRRPFVGPK